MSARVIRTDMPFTIFSLEADKDYLLARLISSLGGLFHSRAGYFGHQACEKYLKALSVQHDGTYTETHKLHELAAICAPNYDFLNQGGAARDLELFDVFEQVGRYGAAANFDPLSKGRHVEGMGFFPTPDVQIAGASIWTDSHLKSLDRFVYWARGHLDFRKASFDDNFASILRDNVRNILVGQWRGPVPLKDVLTRGNDHFSLEALKDNPSDSN